jgi:hydrogenase-4 component B
MTIDESLMLNLLLATLACFSAGAVGALVTARWANGSRIVAHLFALLGAVGALALSIAGLAGGTLQLNIPDLLPIGGTALGVDRTSAFFVLVIAVGAIPASLYALGYTRDAERAGKHSLAWMGFAFNAFLATMVLVALARNVLTFLVLWEAMSLASYFLVMTEHEREDVQRAGWVYLVMTHAGFVALLIGLVLMAHATGTMNFDEWRAASSKLDETTRSIVFILLALGFGSKAGVIPLHIWLPRAHPAAPSHVSALMSGVMIKLGVYGLVRIGFDWLGVGPAWWGGAVLIVAAVSAVLGVLYALVEHDLKRLLAYHSVENIGIILLGVGAGMLFKTYQLDALAALALVAGLYHTLNHATFKSLLFMGAGAILHATHTRNMEEMGGLIKRMPQTAVFFLIGSVAIAALPPFNGFISEWLTFQALLLSFQISAHAVNLIFAVAVAALALTSGLAAACFVKAFGVTFLALPRSEHAEHAREVEWTMRAGMALLALACLALGVAPFIILPALNADGVRL